MISKIKNIIKWLPILWNQKDYDYRYAIDAFKFQLNKTADFLDSDKAFTVNAKNNAKRIRTIINLMDKVYEEDYALEYQDKLQKLYGIDVLDFKFISSEIEGYSELTREYEYWDNAIEINDMHDKLYKESRDKQQKAHELLWKLINHNIRHWWD